MEQRYFERLGETRLRAVIDTFVDSVCEDIMIGFFFTRVDRGQLKEREFEHAARALGARAIDYRGRPLREAHQKHRIMGGQFERRKVLLAQAMRQHTVPEDIAKHLLAHTEKLRSLITQDAGSDCQS